MINFVAHFHYVETDDQLNAINDVIDDFGSGTPSDRLIVGDVAFGKTEVIIRALFLAAKSNIQSIVFVPTTYYHVNIIIIFSKDLVFLILILLRVSRLVSQKEKKQIFKDCAEGKLIFLLEHMHY